MSRQATPRLIAFCLVNLLILLITANNELHAATADQLQNQITAKQSEISKLDQQIAAQEKALYDISQQAGTLQNAVKTADLTIKKLANEIARTEAQIKENTLQLEELGSDIKDTGKKIGEHETALRALLREIGENGRQSLPVVLASYPSLSRFLVENEQLLTLERRIKTEADSLRELKVDLSQKVTATKSKQARAVQLKQELADQQKIAAAERARQNTLLAQTKDQEANYQKLLADSRARREAFAQELQNYESQLRLQIDPGSVPGAARGILSWPLTDIFVTQQFGKTEAAKRLYSSGTHNGVDFRASIGTPVLAAADGTVLGTGDTDLACRGASYGRWVLVKHDNGLASLSGHLSLIKVAKGDRVTRGQLIGYSGQTGYATGPHLHFTVAAGQGVQVGQINSKSCPGAVFTMPLFDARAYLDPMLYLGA